MHLLIIHVCYNCSVEIKGHFHVYSAQGKGTLDIGMYKKIIEASIEIGDPPSIHFLIFYEPPFFLAKKYVTPPLFPPPPTPPAKL